MSHYQPDGWVLVKIGGTDPHYRVFGSWRGGYVHGDSWRLNSGISAVDKVGDTYIFHGHSGSVYECHKNGYGRLGAYNTGVLGGYEEKAQGTFVALREMPEDIMTIDWGCSNDKRTNAV